MTFEYFVVYGRAPKFRRTLLFKLASQILKHENHSAEKITVVLAGDDLLLDLNKKFLQHDYRTDVISFDLGEKGIINGEIYVSVDRARIQAKRYKVKTKTEVLRLIIHGLLHLAGWEDATRSQKLRMRRRENEYIRWFQIMSRKR
ncbi:MAG: rRNA maturation RNase YbeY [Candidatus Kryptoniota bacterium]